MTPEEAIQILNRFINKVRNMDFISDEDLAKASDALATIDMAFQ